jgi:hypothetical protein
VNADDLLHLGRIVRRECFFETHRRDICALTTIVACDALASFGIETDALRTCAVVSGRNHPAFVGPFQCRLTDHWVTRVQKKLLLDVSLNQVFALESLPVVVAAIVDQRAASKLSSDTTVEYVTHPNTMSIETSAWVTRRNPRRRIACRVVRQARSW